MSETTEMVTLTVDGIEVSVPKGTVVIRAAEQVGSAIPRFCDHPGLSPVGACRQCLVEVPDAGNGRGFPAPQASCTLEAANGMIVKTQLTSEVAAQAQHGINELMLINHPLDCPICDKAGECPLQNQSLATGAGQSRYDGVKRRYPKPIRLSPQILLDRERCVLCTRCTRFADQIAGDPQLSLLERGAKQQVGIAPDQPFNSYFSGNVVQICPVGALTAQSYRFSSRPFDLVSTVTTCEGCAAGCQLRSDQRHYEVRRRLAGQLPEVNGEWNCDRGRFGFASTRGSDRLAVPLVRRKGKLVETSWPEALDAAAQGLAAAGEHSGILTGGRLTRETAYGYAKFARLALGTNSIDFRARAISEEETAFLTYLAGRSFGETVHYADLDQASQVVLVGFEPEDEAPIVFLRLRRAVRTAGTKVITIAPYRSVGSAKLDAELIPVRPGGEAAALKDLDLAAGTIVLAGERLATSPGALAALLKLDSIVKWAWIPRRPGEIGALQAGAFPTLLPQANLVGDAVADSVLAAQWGAELPQQPGLDLDAQLAALAAGSQGAVVTAGLELADLGDQALAVAALSQGFVVSLEQRLSDISQFADVVLPVGLLAETEGSFVNWEFRQLAVGRVIDRPTSSLTELRVLAALAEALDSPLGFRTAAEAAQELDRIPAGTVAKPKLSIAKAAAPAGQVVLASWRELLGDSRLLDGADELRASARTPVARLAPATAAGLGLDSASVVTVWAATARGTGPGVGASSAPSARGMDSATPLSSAQNDGITLPLLIDPTMAADVVWAPARLPGQRINIPAGAVVSVVAADPAPAVDFAPPTAEVPAPMATEEEQ